MLAKMLPGVTTLSALSLQGTGGNIAHAGHLGGAAVGAAYFLALRRGRIRW